MNGRPLRFLVLVVGGWAAMRTVLLWQDAPLIVGAPPAPAPIRTAAAMPSGASDRWADPIGWHPADTARVAPFRLARAIAMPPLAPSPASMRAAEPRTLAEVPAAPDQAGMDDDRVIPPPLPPTLRRSRPTRWSGSGWAIARGGSAVALANGQLGGSQAGVRIGRSLDAAGRLAVVLRLSAPFVGRGQEAAPGIEWRLPGMPVRLIAERRIAVDGGRGGAALLATAGLPPTPVAGLTLEGYGQAGAVERAGAFADGAARLTRRIVGREGLRLDVGVGLWGGAQRAAARLDAGPSLGLVVPVADRRVRMTLDWRARLAGRAAPGSGPALSIGSDF